MHTATVPPGAEELSRRRRLWRNHEEAVLYAVAVAVYIPAGALLGTVLLNWLVGLLFPALVVYLIPAAIRRGRDHR